MYSGASGTTSYEYLIKKGFRETLAENEITFVRNRKKYMSGVSHKGFFSLASGDCDMVTKIKRSRTTGEEQSIRKVGYEVHLNQD